MRSFDTQAPSNLPTGNQETEGRAQETENTDPEQAHRPVRAKQSRTSWLPLAILAGFGIGMFAGSVLTTDGQSLASAIGSLFSTETPVEEEIGSATSTESSPGEESATSTTDSTNTTSDTNANGATGGTQTVTVTQPTYPVSNPNGTPDLALLDVMVGVYNERTGEFKEMDVIDLDGVKGSEEVAVRFTIENQGDRTVDEWEFEAELPTKPRETFRYNSEDENDTPLLPTAGRTYTLTFDRVREGIEEVTISVDPDDDIAESNENNNEITIEFETLD